MRSPAPSRSTDPASTGCANASGPNRTLYGYHASGQLEVIHDPIGAGNLASARHRLRYHFDTAGLAIATDDANAGHSETFHDGIGNVRFALNERMQILPVTPRLTRRLGIAHRQRAGLDGATQSVLKVLSVFRQL